MNIHAEIKVLTSEIEFVKFIHGRSPFGVYFVCLNLNTPKADSPF